LGFVIGEGRIVSCLDTQTPTGLVTYMIRNPPLDTFSNLAAAAIDLVVQIELFQQQPLWRVLQPFWKFLHLRHLETS
jgi:hypothetical protein